MAGESVTLVGRPAENHPQQVGRRGALDKVDDRRTPRDLFDLLDREFEFTLDAAASADNALCDHYYDRDSDGLGSSWYDHNVWCNPPYSDIRPWVEKAWREINKDGGGCSCPGGDSCGGFGPCGGFDYVGPRVVVMLLPANRTEQAWWQDLIEPYRRTGEVEVRFLRGRLRFDTPDHDYTAQPKGNRPPFGVCLVIWRRRG